MKPVLIGWVFVKIGLSLSWQGDAEGTLRCSFPSFLPSTIFVHHLYHSVITSFFFLTGPLVMLNGYHIIPIFIISSSYWFGHVCLCLPQQLPFSFSSRVIQFLVFKVSCGYKILSHQQGSFPISEVLSHSFSTPSNLCVPKGNSQDEGWVDPSLCPCMQVQVWSMDHKARTPT
jgi:hypothetical protein